MRFAPGFCRRLRRRRGSHALLEDLHELVDLELVRWMTDTEGELRVGLATNNDPITKQSAATVSSESPLLERMQALNAAGVYEELYA